MSATILDGKKLAASVRAEVREGVAKFVKEHGDAYDVIGGDTGRRVSELHRDLAHATETQGPVVDLIMLRDFVRTYGNGVAPEAHDHLLAAIELLLDDLMKDSRRAGRTLFAPSPRKFRRRLGKAKRADIQPVEPDGVATA